MAPKYWDGDVKCAKWCEEVTLCGARGNQTAVRQKEWLTWFLTFKYNPVNFCLRKVVLEQFISKIKLFIRDTKEGTIDIYKYNLISFLHVSASRRRQGTLYQDLKFTKI
jgi:hypothetical protein